MTVAVQRIRFGLALDGERGWHARDALGESTVGPLGFLSILETQLGPNPRGALTGGAHRRDAGVPGGVTHRYSLL